MAIVGDIVIEGFAPEVGLGLRRNHELIARLFGGGGLVEPLHFGEQRLSGEPRFGG